MNRIIIPDPDDFYDIQQVSIGLINIIKAKYTFEELEESINTFIEVQAKDIKEYLLEECKIIKN